MDYSVIDRYIDRLIEDTTPDAPIWNCLLYTSDAADD